MIANMFIDGQNWEIKGNVEMDLTGHENKLEPSNSGKIYSTSEATVKIVSIDEIKADPQEIPEIIEFFNSCAANSEKFTATLVSSDKCKNGGSEFIFSNCLIQGKPKYSITEKKIDGFEFGFETHTVK